MNIKLIKAAIVILSDGNNPRILNPDFLDRNGIVSKDWEVENVLVTPPFAQVVYKKGFHIVVEDTKLQFLCSKPTESQWDAQLPAIATRYISTLSHVSYRAVGLNFTFQDPDGTEAETEKRLVEVFLRGGPWLSFKGDRLSGTALEFQFRSTQPNMSFRVAVVADSPKKQSNLRIEVNFHQDFLPKQKDERISFINTIRQCHDDFLLFSTTLPF